MRLGELSMKFTTLSYLVFILLISGVLSDESYCTGYKKDSLRLQCELEKDYDAQERPVKSHTDILSIEIDMVPVEIELADSTDQLTLTTWMLMNWTDIFLTWNPDDYSGITSLKPDCVNIWTPEFVSLSTLADDPYGANSLKFCKVNSTGLVSHVFLATYRTYCTADRTYWPFDEHECVLFLGSRLFVGSSLNITLKEVLPDNLKKDKVWDVKDLQPNVFSFRLNSKKNDSYSRLEFKFVLKRHASVFSSTFVFPGAGIAVTILAVLWLDVMSPERIYMLAVIIFDEIMFLEYFTFLFPASGTNPPLLVGFFRDSITMCGICIVITIISRRLIYSSLKPAWLTATIRWLKEKDHITKYLLINVETENLEEKEIDDQSPSTFSLSTQKHKEWKIFVMLIDRLLFLIFFVIYVIIIIRFYPAL